MPKIQLKLMAGLAGLVVVTVLVSGWVAQRGLRQQALDQLESSLASRARLAAELVGELAFARAESEQLTELAVRASAAAGARVTLVRTDGVVVADSDVPVSDLDRVENHAGRAELVAALRGEVGVATRTSATLGRPLLYLAVALGEPPRGLVRLAVNVPDVEAANAELRRQLLAAGGVGLAAALLFSLVLSWISLRFFGELREALAALAGGDLSRRLRWHTGDERREIASAVNAMAAEMEQRVAELVHEKEQLRGVLDGMVEGVLVLGADGRVLLVNRALRDMLGAWGELDGRMPLEVIRSAEIDALLSEALHATTPLVREVELAAEAERVVEIHAVPLRAGSAVSGAVAVFHDTTELRRLEGMRRDFVANASHELKTPVTAIRGFAETLTTQDVGPEDRAKQLGIIRQNAERLSQLVEDLLELSRIESGRVTLEPVALDPHEVAREVLADLAPMFAGRSIKADLAEAEVPAVRADRSALQQVLRNLLDNAAKYSDPGGQVSVRFRADERNVSILVVDGGIGISDEHRARIFERFYRVDTARSRALGGTGLGLAIVKHLVQSMGGEVSLDSRAGEGSTFTVSLPRA